MDSPFDELAKLAGKVLANRWLGRNALKGRAASDDVPDDQRSAGSPAEHSIGHTIAESANVRNPDESSLR